MTHSARFTGIILGGILPLVLLVIWQVLCSQGVFQPYLLPSPLAVLDSIVELAKDGSLWAHIGITMYRILLGFLLGVGLAILFGSVVGFYPLAQRLLDPTLQAFRSIPSLAWVPLFLLWMGITETSKITLIAVGVFFPTYLNLVSGIQGVDRKLIEVGKVYRFSNRQLIHRIILPASLPSFLVGLRGGLGVGWMFVVAAELLGASQGLGYLLVFGQNTTAPEIILASIVLFAILGKFTDALLAKVEWRALHWQDSLVHKR
ncbi:ABC transporter permease [Ammoniphilus resinae]|uniref:Sulfonate transport system permease protein n=1 Tax=Ammoniphilus resinae TaxID=861532 RepID=A0ABS4GQ11_9BACL|nr:ABC transporter permease [Ammoniphilus resinae]MBP1932363.1 sulfonate transport system permease protein [Ammoniphilus resinae]